MFRVFRFFFIAGALGWTNRPVVAEDRDSLCESRSQDPQEILNKRLRQWWHAGLSNRLLPEACARIRARFDDPILELPISDLTYFRTYIYNGNAKILDIISALELINRLFEEKRLVDSQLKKMHPEIGSMGPLIFADMKLWADLVPADLLKRTLKNFLRFEFAAIKEQGDADEISKLADDYLDAFLIFSRLHGGERKLLGKAAKLITLTRAALKLAPYFDELPSSWKKKLRKHWLHTNFEHAPRLKGLRYVGDDSKDELENCGTCPDMDHGHIEGFDAHLLYMDGVLLGSLKLWGDPSMLALNDVADDAGRLILVRGMIYSVSKRWVARAKVDRSGAISLRKGSSFPARPKISLLAPNSRKPGGTHFLRFIDDLIQKRVTGADL